MNIKIDPADKIFSIFIRRRDKRCVRCFRQGEGELGILGLQNSHFFGRSKESTRFCPENCDSLCYGCHQYWGSTDREAYRNFKVKQLGEDGFLRLVAQENLVQKKDRKMSLIICKALLKTLD